MTESTARLIHEATNMTYWCANPNWHTGNKMFDAGLAVTRPAWRTANNFMLRTFFDMQKVLAVSGETVVARNGDGLVDKHMFRRPASISIEAFRRIVDEDVETVNRYLPGISLPTIVSIKEADVFRYSKRSVETVTQTQKCLRLSLHPSLEIQQIEEEMNAQRKNKTLRDLEQLVVGANCMAEREGRHADLAPSSGNLRRSIEDGSVTLIDVTPFYTNGSRAIGDHPRDIINEINSSIRAYEELIGRYGS